VVRFMLSVPFVQELATGPAVVAARAHFMASGFGFLV